MTTTVQRPSQAPIASIDPSRTHAMALEAAGRGDTDEAISLLTQTLHVEPRRASALSDLAVLVHGLGRGDEALRLLNAACAADPDHVAAWENLLDLLIAAGEAGHVRRVVRAWQRARPDEPAALARARSLGLASTPTRDVTRALDRGDAASARRAWLRAVEEDPDDPCLLELARALHATEADPSEAPPDDTLDPAVVVVDAVDLAGVDAAVRTGPGPLCAPLPFVAVVSSENPVGDLDPDRLADLSRVFDAGDARLIATSERGARRARRAGLDVRAVIRPDDAESILVVRRELVGRRPAARPAPTATESDPRETTPDLPLPAHAHDIERRAALIGVLERTLDSSAPPRFLDAGVGDGRISAELARHGTTVAADPSAVRLAIARQRSNDAVEIHAIDLLGTHHAYTRLGRFDAVVALEGVQTLPRPEREAALRRLARLLEDAGVLIVECPSRTIDAAHEHLVPRTRNEIEHDAAAFGFDVVASVAIGRNATAEPIARVVALRPTAALRAQLAAPEAPLITPRAGPETIGAPPMPHLRPLAPPRATDPAELAAPVPPIHWVGDVLAPGGYATYNRNSILWLRRAGLRIGCRNHGVPNENFLASLTPDDLFELRAALAERVVDGVLAINYQPALPTGHDLYRQMRWQHPEQRAYVGLTTFETESMPPHWVGPANAMDAIWVPSSFSIGAFEKAGVDAGKIEAIGFAIDASLYDPTTVVPVTVAGRRDPDSFLFYSVFQWHGRKGWRTLIESWARAFTSDDGVELLVKTMRGVPGVASPNEQIDDHLRTLGVDRSRLAPIHVIDEAVSDAELRGLYAAADAFVLPSRGEGWGIPYMEAMASGLPTIGTRWSGQLDFMNDENAYLIELNRTAQNPDGLVPVDDEMLAFNREYAGQRYADPSVEHLVELMRQVRDRPDEARARGRRAAEDIRTHWSPERYVARVTDATRRLMARVGDRRLDADTRGPAGLTYRASLFEATGSSHDARTLANALIDSNVPVELAARNAGTRVESSDARTTARLVDRILSPSINVDHGPPEDALPLDSHRTNVLRTRFAGDRLPFSSWARVTERDEIWVPSSQQVATLIREGVSPERVRHVPLAVDVARFHPDAEPLPIERATGFCFLACFEMKRRKGWDALLEAFFNEFEPDDDVTLILNVASPVGRLPRDVRAAILKVAHEHARRRWSGEPLPLLLLPGTVDRADMPGLYRAANAYVHPSRACAGGLPVLEAMASGVPVVASGWGAHTDFATPETAVLFDYELVPVAADACAEEPGLAGRLWAEPNVADLRRALRRVKDDAPLRASLTERALEHVRTHHTAEVVGAIAVAEVDRLGSTPPSHPSAPSVRAVWRGPAREVGSLSIVNDALTGRLEASYGVATERRTDPRTFDDPVDADVVISHGWPPTFRRPNGAVKHVLILPWEYGRIPAAWVDAIRSDVDEVWVPSRHVFSGLIASGISADKVRVVPNGVDPFVFQPRGPRIELPTTKGFRFLFVGGTIWRKGADVLLAAYDAAFGPDDDVTLIVKNFGEHGVYRECSGADQLRERAKDASRAEVIVVDETLTTAEMAALYRSCDVLVHPYRAEGFAMPVAEASACGTPAIATAGGATSDFHFKETGWPLRATPTSFIPEAPYQVDGWVLEPDAVALANLMLDVRREPGERKARGAKASTYVRTALAWNTIAEAVAARLRALR